MIGILFLTFATFVAFGFFLRIFLYKATGCEEFKHEYKALIRFMFRCMQGSGKKEDRAEAFLRRIRGKAEEEIKRRSAQCWRYFTEV